MGGDILRRCRIYYAATLLIVITLGNSFAPLPVQAFAPIDSLRDYVGMLNPGQAGVSHTITFVLPSTSPAVDPTDYIQFNFSNYTSVSTPYEIDGSYGVPFFSVNNKTAQITGVSILPGTSVRILGITATNPPDGQNNNVIMSISQDRDGNQVKNLAVVTPLATEASILVSAQIESPLSAITLTGYTSPNTFVTLTENGTVIGTNASDLQGVFRFVVTGLDQGNHTFSLVGTDHSNHSTAQSVIQLFLIKGTSTTASNIILSPTLGLDKTSILPGDTLTISGAAKPDSTINIFTESPLRNYSAHSDPTTGEWQYTLSTTETQKYAPGEYRAYTNVQDAIGNQSIMSNTVNFTVTSPNVDNPPPACDISHGDLNCDGKTNLTDFSILLYHWKTNHKVADINGDGNVNLVDFSVMMFYFRR